MNTITVTSGKFYCSLEMADVRNISLCESHIPNCLELIINHGLRYPNCFIRSISTSGDGKTITMEFSKLLIEEREVNFAIEIADLTVAQIELLESSERYENICKDQQIIIFLPKPKTEAEWKLVGKIVARTDL